MSLWWLIVSVATPLTLTCALQGYVVHVARRQARRGTFRCNETHCFYVPAHVYEKSSNALLTGTGRIGRRRASSCPASFSGSHAQAPPLLLKRPIRSLRPGTSLPGAGNAAS
ncbi:hypothetical protein NL108_015371 [Boleophthalmus pectinirostris]|nr:hypothetical protein NL108_015371 [Boleophthalmus pectinirostris]